MIIWWYIYFYGSFTLNWTIIPFVIGYLEAGEFTIRGKSWFSIKYNAPWYLAYFVAFLLLLGYLFLTKSGTETLKDGGGVVGVIIGLNISAGLLWLALVVGYGIVKIPISFYSFSDAKSKLKYY